MIDETKPPDGWYPHPDTDKTCMRPGGVDIPIKRAHAIAHHEAAPYIAEALELREAAALAVWNAPAKKEPGST